MKISLLLFFVSFQAGAQSLYTLNSKIKIYDAGADIAVIHELEKEDLYQHLAPSKIDEEGPAYLAAKYREANLDDIAHLQKLDLRNPVIVNAEQILNQLIHNPVAGNNPLNHYDEKGNAGFCFGRALWVEKELQKHKVDQKYIYKIFVLGELYNGQIMWDYHVATMVIDQQGRKLMIDSLFDRVYELDVWFDKMKKFAMNSNQPVFRVYFAKADKFQARAGFFSSYDVFDPQYGNYFFDLLPWL